MRTLLLVLVALAAAPPAQARVVRLQDGPLITTDGKRFAVELQDARALVVDTRDGSRSVVDRPEPGCYATAVGGGHLLWECARPSTYTPRMIHLPTGREVPVGGREMFERLAEFGSPSADGIEVLQLGSTWMTGTSTPCYHCDSFFHLNWRTGETAERLGGARDVEDLDRRTGSRRLCRPARRSRTPDDLLEFESPWRPMQAAGGWTLSGRVLRRCGGGRAIRVGRGAELLPRHVVWLAGRTLVVRRLASSTTRRNRLSMLAPADASLAVTGRRVYVTDGGRSDRPRRRWRADLG